MLDPNISAAILVTFILVFGVALPVLNTKFPKFISYRWSVVVVVLALLIGATVDFSGLPDDARRTVLVGGLIIAGAFVVLRTVEKCLANGWLRGARVEVKKGDLSAKIESADDKKM